MKTQQVNIRFGSATYNYGCDYILPRLGDKVWHQNKLYIVDEVVFNTISNEGVIQYSAIEIICKSI